MVIKFKDASKCVVRQYNTDGDTDMGINGYTVATENQGGQNVLVATGPSGNVPNQYEIYDEEVTAEIESFEIFSENIYLSDNEKKCFSIGN